MLVVPLGVRIQLLHEVEQGRIARGAIIVHLVLSRPKNPSQAQ